MGMIQTSFYLSMLGQLVAHMAMVRGGFHCTFFL